MSSSPYQHTLVIQPDAWDAVTERTRAGRGGTSAATVTTTIIRRYAALMAEAAENIVLRFSEPELESLANLKRRQTVQDDDLVGMLRIWSQRRPQDRIIRNLLDKAVELTSLERIALLDYVERSVANGQLNVSAA